MSKIYNIPVSWEMMAIAKIEAESLDEAIEKAEDNNYPLPTDSMYVDGSFEVNHDIIECYNEEEDE